MLHPRCEPVHASDHVDVFDEEDAAGDEEGGDAGVDLGYASLLVELETVIYEIRPSERISAKRDGWPRT